MRIWLAQTRLRQYEREHNQRTKAKALQVWLKRKEQVESYEQKVATFRRKVDKRLAFHCLKVWIQRLAHQSRLERRSQRAYETALKAKMVFAWRLRMRAHAKAMKQAKLARQLFLERMVWDRWRHLMEERNREKNIKAFQNRKLQGILKLWSNKAKRQRNLRRKGEVVMMAAQLVSSTSVSSIVSFLTKLCSASVESICTVGPSRSSSLKIENIVSFNSVKKQSSGVL
jgi:protein SFI1